MCTVQRDTMRPEARDERICHQLKLLDYSQSCVEILIEPLHQSLATEQVMPTNPKRLEDAIAMKSMLGSRLPLEIVNTVMDLTGYWP